MTTLYDLDHNYFSSIDTAAKAYSLGLVMADGSVTKNRQFVFASTDRELTTYLHSELKISKEYREYTPTGGRKQYIIGIMSPNLTRDLMVLGRQPCSHLEKIPCSSYRKDFIRGFFDGDGCVYRNKNRSGGLLSIIASKSLCQTILDELGYGSLMQHSKSIHMWYWRCFSKKDFLAFRKDVYTDSFFLKRKKDNLDLLIKEYSHEGCWAKKS